MDLQSMSVINTMKKNVEKATIQNIGDLCAEVPALMHLANQQPREAKLGILEVARSIIDKFKELVPEIVEDEGWAEYEKIYAELNTLIMETRFAVR